MSDVTHVIVTNRILESVINYNICTIYNICRMHNIYVICAYVGICNAQEMSDVMQQESDKLCVYITYAEYTIYV